MESKVKPPINKGSTIIVQDKIKTQINYNYDVKYFRYLDNEYLAS